MIGPRSPARKTGIGPVTVQCAFAARWSLWTYIQARLVRFSLAFFFALLKWAIPGLFSCLFSSFLQTNKQFLQQINVRNCSSSIRCWDLNPWPSEHESPPRPGLCLSTTINHFSQSWWHFGLNVHKDITLPNSCMCHQSDRLSVPTALMFNAWLSRERDPLAPLLWAPCQCFKTFF